VIIILSGPHDSTADRVEAELGRRSARYTRVDLSDFPQRITASAYLDNSGYWTGHMRHADGWSVAWEDITAVYYRRPNNFDPAPGLTTAERRFAVAEARGGFGGVLASLDARWVNHPFRVADAEFKPAQLTAARDDFSVDRNGDWWFLECNPNGQWGFITEATDLPIASAIADLLIGDTTL